MKARRDSPTSWDRNGCDSVWSVSTWLIPSANVATRGVWSTNGRVGAVLSGLRFARLLERLRLLDPLLGTVGALDGDSGDILNDDGSRS